MKRLAYAKLLQWKRSEGRKPLMVRGVRQCGKTYLVKEFGEECYQDFAYFSFEGNPDLHKVFEKDLDVRRIIEELGLLRNKRITSDTLVFFDEIQFCGAAIASLKYFAEELPEFHIICAGSLLGIKLAEREGGGARYSFPVGKVSYLTLYPMSFLEFVLAVKGELIFDALDSCRPFDEIPDTLMGISESLYREYCAVGGMPEAVSSWVSRRDMADVERIHTELLSSYENDCARYAPGIDIPRILSIWRSIPAQLAKENRRFMFGQAVEGARFAQLKDALQWLVLSGLVHTVPLAGKPSVPLCEVTDGNMYKLYYCDIGLLRTMAGIPADRIVISDEYGMKGAICENFALNEMLSSVGDRTDFYYWNNLRGRAEIDFLAVLNGRCVPIEVKSGNVKRLSSMEFYIGRYGPEVAVLSSWKNVRGGTLRSVPLCIISKIEEFTKRRYRLDNRCSRIY